MSVAEIAARQSSSSLSVTGEARGLRLRLSALYREECDCSKKISEEEIEQCLVEQNLRAVTGRDRLKCCTVVFNFGKKRIFMSFLNNRNRT